MQLWVSGVWFGVYRVLGFSVWGFRVEVFVFRF